MADSRSTQNKLYGDLASLEDDIWVLKKKYRAVAEAWVKTTGLKVPSFRTAIEEEEEGPDSRLQDQKRYRQSLRAKEQAQLPNPDAEPAEPIKPNWGEFNPAEFTSSQEEALQEETQKRELSPVRQNKPRQIMRRDSESERALLKLSGKNMSQ
ncbi:14538_t:CDS:1, partial [Acaulospora colombiana]